MNCFFCQTDITNYRSPGLSKPAGTFTCQTCAKAHDLNKVIMSINVELKPIEAIIYLTPYHYFRIDYYKNQTQFIIPHDKKWSPGQSLNYLITLDTTSITPATAKSKGKTYLIFS